MASLISLMGGPTSFVSRLNYLHESGLNYIGNEPSFLTVFQYHYAGRPGLSSYRSHTYIPTYFSTNTSGLPGNDDSGKHVIKFFLLIWKKSWELLHIMEKNQMHMSPSHTYISTQNH